MKKIGFIDYYLSEWHADNYPAWIKAQAGEEFQVMYAYAAIEPPIAGRISNREWAEKQGIELLSSIEELIEKSDCIVVLSPDNSEMHYELSHQALASGKPVYIDKTFADSKEEAQRIFAVGEANGSSCFSSSALRFSKKLADRTIAAPRTVVGFFGGGAPAIYLIHPLECLAVMLGTDVAQVRFIGTSVTPAWELQFCDNRTAYLFRMEGSGFSFTLQGENGCETVAVNDDFFGGLIAAMLDFFRTGDVPVSHTDTTALMAVRAACLSAMETPSEWVAL